jgi:hypothetical protein
MAEVGKVQGPEGPKDGVGKKDTRSVDADKFKSAMRRRVDEVSQTDPDEQKKRKRREETEAEDQAQAAAPPPPVVSAETTQKKKAQFTSAIRSRGPTPQARSPGKAFRPPPVSVAKSSQEEEQMQLPESTQLNLRRGETQQASSPGGGLAVGPPESEAPPAFPQTGVNTQPPSYASPGRDQSVQEQETPQAPQEKAAERGKEKQKQAAAPLPTPLPLETPVKKREDAAALLAKKKAAPKKVPEGEEAVQAAAPPPTVPVAPTAFKEKKEEAAAIGATGGIAAPQEGISMPLPEEVTPLPAYAHFSPQIEEIFHRMVGVMTVLHLSGITETVVTLNSPQFASSVFFGSQIIIQEFSTAPKEFNIQFNGSPQAVALFQGSAQDLMAAFQQGNWGFKVHRLQTGHLEEKPLFHRKGAVSGEKEENQPGGS